MTETLLRRNLQMSLLWVAVLFAMLFRDIHQLGAPGYLDEMSSMDVPEWLFLIAGIAITFPILMIPANLWITGGKQRLANIGAAVLTLAGAISIMPSDMDDWWFFAVEAVLLAIIVRVAWQVPEED